MPVQPTELLGEWGVELYVCVWRVGGGGGGGGSGGVG